MIRIIHLKKYAKKYFKKYRKGEKTFSQHCIYQELLENTKKSLCVFAHFLNKAHFDSNSEFIEHLKAKTFKG